MAFNLDNISNSKKVDKIKEVDNTSFLKKEITFLSKSFNSKVKESFYAELSVLLNAGITLKKGLDLIANSEKKEKNKDILNAISTSIVSGQSLSEAIKNQKEFTEYEYYSLKIGEETGTLNEVTRQLGDFFSRKNEQRRALISALTYPIIILSTAVLVLVFMLQFVVPMFKDIFKQQNVELPAITKFIVAASDFMQAYWWLLLLLLLLPFVFKSLLSKKEWFNKLKDTIVLKTPILGKFTKTVYLSQFTQAVSLLTASKVPVINSIQLVKEMIPFYPLKEALTIVEENILKGKSLSESMTKHSFFDEKMIAMVKVAEETNQNEFIFQRLNTQYNAQVQQRSKMVSTILEPFIILFVGIIVGVILIAMYLPMFKLSSVLG